HIADIAANGSVTVVPSALEDSNLAQVQAEAFLSPDGQILNFVPTLIKGKNGVDLLQEGLLPKTGFFIQFERISSEDLKAKIVEQSRNNPNCASEAGK
ncbi:MAG: hypothetical protein KDD35_08625, partial [Bdellovibrionales bacterium]|nr:hypothetical protein [Bdellovibrionales bacterium]